MTRPRPKADYLEHAWHFYNVLFRRARAVHSGAFDCTWGQLVAACRYEPDAKVQSSLERYAAVLAELGLVRIAGVRDGAGRWQRLDVELLDPDESPERRGRAWTRRRLTAAEIRLLGERCRGARAGRLPRRLAPRLQRRSNLGTPLWGGEGFAPPTLPGLACPRGRAESADGLGKTRSSETLGAIGGACGTGTGFAGGAAALDGHETPPGSSVSLEAVQRAVIRAALESRGDRRAVLDVALQAQADGVAADVVVRAVWLALRGRRGAKLSPDRGRDLEVALRRLDRFGAFGAGRVGAGVELAVDRLLDDFVEPGATVFEHLGGLTAWLAAVARRWRRDARIRAGERGVYRARIRPRPRSRGPWHWPDEEG